MANKIGNYLAGLPSRSTGFPRNPPRIRAESPQDPHRIVILTQRTARTVLGTGASGPGSEDLGQLRRYAIAFTHHLRGLELILQSLGSEGFHDSFSSILFTNELCESIPLQPLPRETPLPRSHAYRFHELATGIVLRLIAHASMLLLVSMLLPLTIVHALLVAAAAHLELRLLSLLLFMNELFASLLTSMVLLINELPLIVAMLVCRLLLVSRVLHVSRVLLVSRVRLVSRAQLVSQLLLLLLLTVSLLASQRAEKLHVLQPTL